MARKPTAPETPSAPAGGAVVKAAPGVAVPDGTAPPPPSKKPFWTHLYFQVLLAIALGALIGHFYPSGVDAAGRPEPGLGEQLKPLGDAFIRLVKMIIAPVILLTVATGLAHLRDLGRLGKVVGKAFAYFLTFSTLVLIIGLVVANVVRPGAGMNVATATLDPTAVAQCASRAHDTTIVGFLMNIIPKTVVGAFAGGEILQALFFAILFGISLAAIGARAQPVLTLLESVSEAFFKLVAILMKAAPIGAFGAFAFTIVVAKWEKGLDRDALRRALDGDAAPVDAGSREADSDQALQHGPDKAQIDRLARFDVPVLRGPPQDLVHRHARPRDQRLEPLVLDQDRMLDLVQLGFQPGGAGSQRPLDPQIIRQLAFVDHQPGAA